MCIFDTLFFTDVILFICLLSEVPNTLVSIKNGGLERKNMKMLEDFLQHSASHYSQFNGWKNFRMFQCNSGKYLLNSIITAGPKWILLLDTVQYSSPHFHVLFTHYLCPTTILCTDRIRKSFVAEKGLNLLLFSPSKVCQMCSFCFSTHRRWKLQPCEVMGLCKWCCLLFITVQTLEQFSNL